MNQEQTFTIHQATLAEVEQIVPLFDAYRQFYGKLSNPGGCREFLLERFKYHQSVIFLARDADGIAVGFTQLYPSFSSGSLAQTFILNDLFVSPAVRRQGVASRLLQAAAEYGRMAGAIRLTLSTAVGNQDAQALYEGEGWHRDPDFYVYHLPLQT